jgi:hypothetical protein
MCSKFASKVWVVWRDFSNLKAMSSALWARQRKDRKNIQNSFFMLKKLYQI